MTVSILVDDESDVAELFRQCFCPEVRQGTYAMHFANSGEEALLKNPPDGVKTRKQRLIKKYSGSLG